MLSRNAAPALLGRAISVCLRSGAAEPAATVGFKLLHSDQGVFLADDGREEKKPSLQLTPGRLPLSLQAVLHTRKTPKRFMDMTARPYSTEVQTKEEKPVVVAQHVPSTNVTPYLLGLVFLHVAWTMGGVDWMVSLNTSIVQSAVWVTALSLVSPAAVWTQLKRYVHVDNEATLRWTQTSSAVKVL